MRCVATSEHLEHLILTVQELSRVRRSPKLGKFSPERNVYLVQCGLRQVRLRDFGDNGVAFPAPPERFVIAARNVASESPFKTHPTLVSS